MRRDAAALHASLKDHRERLAEALAARLLLESTGPIVAAIPGVPTAPLLAASLALRLLTIATEVLALVGNRLASRFHGRHTNDSRSAGTVDEPDATGPPATARTLEA